MKKVILGITFLIVSLGASVLMPATVQASGNGCPPNHTLNLDNGQCIPCPPPGPYGISVCPPTGIIFEDDGSLSSEAAGLMVLSLFGGVALILNGRILKLRS